MTRWAPRTATRTSSVLAVIAMSLIFGLGGCSGSDTPSEPPDPQPTTPAPAVSFTATVDVGSDAVHIVYRLVNKSGGELLAFKGDKVWVTGQDDGRVQIARRAFTMPQGSVTWSHPVPADGVRVPDGQQLTGDVSVPLPLKRRHPYGDDYGNGTITLPDPIKEIIFCLGVVRTTDVTVTLPQGQQITLPHLASTTAIQHLLCSAPTKVG